MNKMVKGQRRWLANLLGFLFEFLLMLYLLHDVPVIGWITPSFVYLALTGLLYVLTLLKLGTNTFFKYFRRAIPISLMYILILFLQAVTTVGSMPAFLYGYVQLLIYLVIGQYILGARDYKLAKHLAIVLGLAYTITSVTTFLGLQQFPNASRELATGLDGEYADNFAQYLSMNIGGFNFVYYLTFSIPLLIALFKRGTMNKVILLALVAVFVITIIETQYTAAFLFSLASLTLFFVRKDFTSRKSITFFILAAVILLLGYELLPLALSSISGKVESEILSSRLDDLVEISLGSYNFNNDGDIGARMNHYQISWDYFSRSGCMGTWDLNKIGGHSYLLDRMATFGLLGLIVFIIMWVSSWKRFLKWYKRSNWYGYVLFSFLVALALSVVNPHNNLFFVGFIIPICIVLLDRHDNPALYAN